MSIVHPDKEYLGVSGHVPRWRADKSIKPRQLCYHLAHIAEGCCFTVPPFYPPLLALGALKALCL